MGSARLPHFATVRRCDHHWYVYGEYSITDVSFGRVIFIPHTYQAGIGLHIRYRPYVLAVGHVQVRRYRRPDSAAIERVVYIVIIGGAARGPLDGVLLAGIEHLAAVRLRDSDRLCLCGGHKEDRKDTEYESSHDKGYLFFKWYRGPRK